MRKIVALIALAGGAQACGPLEDALNPREEQMKRALALQPMPANASNAVADDPGAAFLGQKLFFDTRLSGPLGPENDGVSNGSLGHAGESGKVACASCHDPAAGGADRRSRPGAASLAAGFTRRNTPTVFNAGYSPLWQFWDGRKDSLWSQALAPLESGEEHNTTRLEVAHLVYDFFRGDYESIFGPLPDLSDTVRFPPAGKPGDAAFDSMTLDDQRAINRVFSNLGKSLEAYERKLTCTDSPFDRWIEGDGEAMTSLAVQGYKLFVGKAGCLECHRGGTFTDYRFHNIGVPQVTAETFDEDNGRMNGITSLMADVFNRAGEYSDEIDEEHLRELEGRGEVEGQFKTPSLRCVELTAPYMHNGAYTDLWAVVNHYRFGGATGNFVGTKDPAVRSLDLTDADLEALVEFLKSLTGTPLPQELVTRPEE